jgi:hypothetical protein
MPAVVFYLLYDDVRKRSVAARMKSVVLFMRTVTVCGPRHYLQGENHPAINRTVTVRNNRLARRKQDRSNETAN